MSSSSSSSSSSRRPFRNRGGGGAGARGRATGNHQRFAPKPTPSASPPPAASASVAPLRRPPFLRYLPQDEALASGLGADTGALDTVDSQAVVDLLNDQLSSLLRLSPRDFWREVAANDSLHQALDSYLLFRTRWYDLPHRRSDGTIAGVLVGDTDLSRRVFMMFYRMSSNRDPGAPVHDSLSAKEHGALMQDKKLLDLPKLLDICAIYGRDNGELTKTLVNNAMKAHPTLVMLLPETCHQFLTIASTMHKRCSSSLKALADVGDQGVKEYEHLCTELVEVVDFINDSVVTLDAFVDAYRQAAIYFSYLSVTPSDEKQELINTLAFLHDSLLPSLHEVFVLSARNGNNEVFLNNRVIENMDLDLKLLSSRVAKFGHKVLEICYLSDEFPDDVTLQSCGKTFPSQVSDPVLRGDILVQTFREISNHPVDLTTKKCSWGTFLQIIERNYYLLSRIDSLRTNGWMFLDDEQFQSLIQTIASSLDDADKMQNIPISLHSNKLEISEDVILESKISQIKDIFPEYGKGFLAACLDVYDHNPETVIQRILEGTLHEDLLSMDISAEQIVSSKVSSKVDGKGKGILVESVMQSKDKGKGILVESVMQSKDKGKGILVEHVTQSKDKGKDFLYVQPSQTAGRPSSFDPFGKREGDGSFSSATGRFTRKSHSEQSGSEVLDWKPAKDLVKSTVLAAAEYEDEYDDSFDDLGLSVAETATEEIEISGDSSSSEVQKNGSRWNSRKTPQFYVKDGKNYSYKISGSVAVSDAREAAALVQSQKGLIHGLGRGGNIPYGVTRGPPAMDEVTEDLEAANSYGRVMENSTSNDHHGRQSGNYRGRGRGRGRGRNVPNASDKLDSHGQVDGGAESSTNGDQQHHHPRGRGSGRGGNHYRKDRAMRKHFSGLTGF